ncbi:MAG: 1-(5-phosphoribosyl)-5-[(5-phosphoribosylamino)methylideneamino]imidazole-4-carboxamide isomerase [Robiginitomaculum sp.]
MIFPAIDLMDGGCVRLLKGDFSQRTDYSADPITMAQSFEEEGAEWLHVVDLDGAKNQKVTQSELIINIANFTNMKVQTGGGLRNTAQIKNLLDNGLERVVIGSLAIENPKLVKEWMAIFGSDKVVLAIDIFQDIDGIPRPATHGWTQTSKLSLWQVVDDFLEADLKTILVTDIAKDGGLQGTNTRLYQEIMKHYPDLDLITSGGVGSLDDVQKIKEMKPAGIIIGKALYEQNFSLAEAIKC